MKAAVLTTKLVIKLLVLANNALRSIEQKCHDMKREEEALTSKNLNAARTIHLLSNDIVVACNCYKINSNAFSK